MSTTYFIPPDISKDTEKMVQVWNTGILTRGKVRESIDLSTIDNTYHPPQTSDGRYFLVSTSTTAVPTPVYWYPVEDYETVIENGEYVLRRKPNNEDNDMEEINIEDVSIDNTPEYYRNKVPFKGWYTQVGRSGIEYYTLLSGTFKMKDEGILQEIADRILDSPRILLNHENNNPVDPDAIRVYYTREDTVRNIVISAEVSQLIDRKNTYFMGYIPGERGEYLNRILVDFWKGNRYTHTRVEPICIYSAIPAPGKDTKFWNLLIRITLEFDFTNSKTIRPDIL